MPIKDLWRDLGRFDRRIWVLFAIEIITSFGFGAAVPFISIYLHVECGLSMRAVGVVALLLVVCSSAGRILGGELSDRIGRRGVLRTSMGIRSAVLLGLTIAVHFQAHWMVIVGWFWLVRILGGTLRPALSAMIADLTDETNRVKAYGLQRVGVNVGWAGGAAVGGMVVYHGGYAAAFLIPAIGSLAGCMIAWTMLGRASGVLTDKPFKLSSVFSPGADKRLLVFCLASLPLLLLVGQFLMTTSVFAKERVGLDELHVGWLYALNGLVVVLVQWPMSFLVTRVGLRASLTGGGLLYAGGYFYFGFTGDFTGMLIGMLVISLGEVTYNPAMQTVVAEIAPPGKTGRYMGFYGLAEAIGWGAGPFLGGMLWDAVRDDHAAYLWGPLAALGGITVIAYLLVLPRVKRTVGPDAAELD